MNFQLLKADRDRTSPYGSSIVWRHSRGDFPPEAGTQKETLTADQNPFLFQFSVPSCTEFQVSETVPWCTCLSQGNGVPPDLGHKFCHLSLEALDVLALVGPGMVEDQLCYPLPLRNKLNSTIRTWALVTCNQMLAVVAFNSWEVPLAAQDGPGSTV